MACGTDISNVCVNPVLSTCVDHEGELGKNTKIEHSCVNQSEVNEDLYSILDDTIEELDVSGITSECIEIPAKVTVGQLMSLYEAKICDLSKKVSALEDLDYSELDISEWGLTVPICIADSCANPPTTLGPLLQAIMDNRNCA